MIGWCIGRDEFGDSWNGAATVYGSCNHCCESVCRSAALFIGRTQTTHWSQWDFHVIQIDGTHSGITVLSDDFYRCGSVSQVREQAVLCLADSTRGDDEEHCFY